MKKIILSFIYVFFSIIVLAQDSTVALTNRQATGLRAEGKIFVVLAVSVTILTGLFIYLIRLDRKISRLEKGS